jgi:hypothetical protein
LSGVIRDDADRKGQPLPVSVDQGQTLSSSIRVNDFPTAGYQTPISLWYYDGCNSRYNVMSTMLIDIAARFQISLDKIHLPDGGTAATYYDDDVFSLTYMIVPPNECSDISCADTDPRVITGIGSPRDVPPPGVSPILLTRTFELVPGTPGQALYFVILIVNAGENQAPVSSHIAGAGRVVLHDCREPSCAPESIKPLVDELVFAGGDKGGCDGTVVIGKEKISTGVTDLNQLTSDNGYSHTETKSQSLVNHGDCIGVFASGIGPAHYDYTWTITRVSQAPTPTVTPSP